MAYVYRHIRLDKNEPFYIGIGSDKQFNRAYEKTRRSDFWKRIYGITEIKVEIMLYDISNEEAKLKEKEFISIYGRKNKGHGTLCNLTDGGDGLNGYVFTNSHKKKLSEAAKKRDTYQLDEARKKSIKVLKSKVWSDDERIKLSQSQRGIKKSKEHIDIMSKRMIENNPSHNLKGTKSPNYKGKIYVYKDGVQVYCFEGLKPLCESIGCCRSKVSAVLNGRRKSHKGYFFTRTQLPNY